MSLQGDKLRNALQSGPVRAIGGIVYDAAMKPLMNTTEMYSAVQELNSAGIKVGRVDAGGSPTWAVEESKRRIRENALNIVNILLENAAPVAGVRKACANCEREFNVHDPNASHGVCKRHTIEHIKEAGRVQNRDYTDFIRRTEAKPDSEFAPDLAQPENAEYRNSLGAGKTQGQTDRLEKVRAAYFPQT